MSYLQDLSVFALFGMADARVLAVGWLSSAHSYNRGEVSAEVFARICELLLDPWQPGTILGRHQCSLCRFTTGPSELVLRDNTTVSIGSRNLFVPAGDVLYVAPSMVAHYIDSHEYQPPDEFIAAIKECPPMRSVEYLRQMKHFGLHRVIRRGSKM